METDDEETRNQNPTQEKQQNDPPTMPSPNSKTKEGNKIYYSKKMRNFWSTWWKVILLRNTP